MTVSDECHAAMVAALITLEPAARKLLTEAETGGALFATRRLILVR